MLTLRRENKVLIFTLVIYEIKIVTKHAFLKGRENFKWQIS